MGSAQPLRREARRTLDEVEVSTVLLMGSERATRATLAASLRSGGFTVSEARDGSEMLEIVGAAVQEDGAAPGVVVVDVATVAPSDLAALGRLAGPLRPATVIAFVRVGDEAGVHAASSLGLTIMSDASLEPRVFRVTVGDAPRW